METILAAIASVLIAVQDLLFETKYVLCFNVTDLLASVTGVLMDVNTIIGKVIVLLTSFT